MTVALSFSPLGGLDSSVDPVDVISRFRILLERGKMSEAIDWAFSNNKEGWYSHFMQEPDGGFTKKKPFWANSLVGLKKILWNTLVQCLMKVFVSNLNNLYSVH